MLKSISPKYGKERVFLRRGEKSREEIFLCLLADFLGVGSC
jgi:hypothetical protein